MLYFFIGDEVQKAKAVALKRATGTEVVRFGEGGEPFANVNGYLKQRGLFAPKVTLILDRPLDDTDAKSFILEECEVLVRSDTTVIAIQPDIDALTLKKVEKIAEVVRFGKVGRDKPPRPNTFALSNAVLAGDRKKAWILYRSLIEEGVSPEELHGTLAWSARNALLKLKQRNAPAGDAELFSADLVRLYHDARSGRGDLEDVLEIFLLEQ